ncbi:hypothetical protein JCM10207_008221 [Rhodosporidiobolus poonsookiae]
MTTAAPPRVAILDCFTSQIYRGNPAAVVLTPEPLDTEARTKLAIELAQPAVAFVSHASLPTPDSSTPPPSADSPLFIRWHTSSGAALPLCGHATLAASHFLLHSVFPDLEAAHYRFPLFAGGEGVLKAVKTDDGRVEIALPAAYRTRELAGEMAEKAREAMKQACEVSEGDIEAVLEVPAASAEIRFVLVRLAPSVDLGALKFKTEAFLSVPHRGFYVTNLHSEGSTASTHFRSRVFFPRVGLPEDHVCGSAHTVLGPYWISQLAYSASTALPPLVEVDQVSERGGRIGLRWDGKAGEEGGVVALRGEARPIVACFTQQASKGALAAVVMTTEPLSDCDDAAELIRRELNLPAVAFLSHPSFPNPPPGAKAPSLDDPVTIRARSNDALSFPTNPLPILAAAHFLLNTVLPTSSVAHFRIDYPLESASTVSVTKADDGRLELPLRAAYRPRVLSGLEVDSIKRDLHRVINLRPAVVEDIVAVPQRLNAAVENHGVLVIRVSSTTNISQINLYAHDYITLEHLQCKAYVFTNAPNSAAGSAAHYRSRVFWLHRTTQDHDTGATHTALAPYWTEHFSSSSSPLPDLIVAEQASERGGRVGATWDGKWGEEGGVVKLRAEAKLLMTGELHL